MNEYNDRDGCGLIVAAVMIITTVSAVMYGLDKTSSKNNKSIQDNIKFEEYVY